MKNCIFDILKEAIVICENNNIKYWVIGGFAVDAKIGHLSREHGDIDFCIHQDSINNCLKWFFKHGFRATKEGLKYVFYKADIKIDIFELFINGDYYERRREWFTAKYPKEIFDNFQILELNGLKLRAPSNEGLRYYGSKTIHQEDAVFTSNLPYNQNIFSKIEYHEFADYKKSKEGVQIEDLI